MITKPMLESAFIGSNPIGVEATDLFMANSEPGKTLFRG